MAHCFTIGHSNHATGELVGLLRRYQVNCVADVRSQPYSRRFPQFNRESLTAELKSAGVNYLFMGQQLGARYDDPALLTEGQVDFGLVVKTENYQAGIQRLLNGMAKGYTIALMCAERNPLDCHRFILVARSLADLGVKVEHITPTQLISQAELEQQLLAQYKLEPNAPGLFADDNREVRLRKAYRLRNADIGYRPLARATENI